MICDYCGKDGAKLRYKTQVCGPKKDKFLVDKVPVVRCPHCHQTYMTAQTAKTLDQLVQQRRELAQPPNPRRHRIRLIEYYQDMGPRPRQHSLRLCP